MITRTEHPGDEEAIRDITARGELNLEAEFPLFLLAEA